MNRITLDDNHIYRLDGVIIPGFSEISKAMGLSDYSHVNQVVMDAASLFGSAAHKACELSDLGTLDLNSLSKPLECYLKGWRYFLRDFGAEIYHNWIETTTGSIRYRFGCKPDRIMTLDKLGLSVVEIKTTTTIMPVIALQTASHKIAFEEETKMKIKSRLAVQLTGEDDGVGYKVYPFKNKADEDCFIYARKLYQWKKENL